MFLAVILVVVVVVDSFFPVVGQVNNTQSSHLSHLVVRDF
jgi:hypothetical protein